MKFQHILSKRIIPAFWIVLGIGAAACSTRTGFVTNAPSPDLSRTADFSDKEIAGKSGMVLVSDAFDPGEKIPGEYTCDGEDVSVPLAWMDPPDSASYLALIVQDPNAPGGTWIHWIIFNIPIEAGSLAAGVGSENSLRNIGERGLNSWGQQSYAGPCPPSGEHRYLFKAYALDGELIFETPPDVKQITAAMKGHVLAEAILMGVYDRGP